MTFGLINEGLKATTASGQYSLGMGEIINEDYETLRPWFTKIVEELTELHNQPLIINEKEYILEYFFTGDMKLLLIFLGLKPASSLYPCAWCTTHRDDLHLQDPEKSIINPCKQARSETERNEMLHLYKDHK